MILTIAGKEFLEKILDFRVIVSFVVAIILTVLATIIAGGEFEARKADFDKRVSTARQDLEQVKVYSQYKPTLFYPPSPLSVFSRGINLPTPITVDIRMEEVPRYRERIAGSNPMMNIFDSLDIATVIGVLYSLLVILLTFDSFSGEKEHGTLRLALSNPVARVTLLYGKCLGTVLILGAVVGLTYLIALTTLTFFSEVALSPADYLRIGAMAVGTSCYLGAFGGLGIFCSIKLHHSSVSLAVLLFFWFFAALLQPNLITYLATQSDGSSRSRSPQPVATGDCSAMRELEELQKTAGKVMDDRSKRWYSLAPGKSIGGSYGVVRTYPVIADADYDILDYLTRQVQVYRKLADCGEHDFNQIKTGILDRLDDQLAKKRTLDMVSPGSLLSHGMAILAGTDIDNADAFFSEARRYRTAYLSYLDGKGVFSSNAQLYFSRLASSSIDREATRLRMTAYEKNRSQIPYIDNQPPLDLRDAPAFTTGRMSFPSDLAKAVPVFLPLLFFVAAPLVLAGVTLQSYDPR